jgi:hypothetical protein
MGFMDDLFGYGLPIPPPAKSKFHARLVRGYGKLKRIAVYLLCRDSYQY